MAKGSNNLSGRRSSSHNTKPYDANNSFVKKVATKVTDLIPQRSWISKWFNSSQNEGDALDDNENAEEVESEEEIQKPPPLKRPCIRMDVTHPPGTFLIQTRAKTPVNKASSSKQQYSICNETSEDFSEPAMAGPSRMSHLISSTPAMPTDIRNIVQQRSELNSITVATNNGTTNGTDDNSESSESTSGCSSLIPQINRQEAPSNVSYNSSFSNRKSFNNDKLTFTNRMQSPRSLFLDSNRDSLSNRRPSFNASVMTNTSDRASPLSSPFYSGNTTFGGANAAGLYKRSRTLFNSSNEIQLKVPRRTSVEVKPSNTTGVDSSGMSQTAKKILEALEHFSSPITDAKKIPLKMINNTSSISKKRTREETSPTVKVGLRHLTRELTVPNVPDILKLRRRQKLQNITSAVRKIVSARTEPPPLQEYHLRTQADEGSKHHGKLKVKTANLDEEDTVEPVNLPSIPLPISSLPNFNFMSPVNSKTVDKSCVDREETFTFASPIKVTNITQNLKSINNFTFSRPITADKQSVDNSNNSSSPLKRVNAKSTSPSNCVPTVTQNFIWSTSSTAPRPKEKTKNRDSPVPTTSNELKSGSVMDVLDTKSNKTGPEKSSETKMQVELNKDSINKKANAVTLDTNKNDIIIIASSKPDTQQDTSNMWECLECLIKNSNSETQCIACKTTRRSPNDNKASELLPSSSNISESKTTTNDHFGSQFKMSNNQWECTSCYVRNKETDQKCVACTSLKSDSNHSKLATTKLPNSDLNNMKSLEESWECSNCALRNSANSMTCSSCDIPKSNLLKTNPKNDKSFTDEINTVASQKTGMPINTSLNTSTVTKSETMDKFKPSKETWECPCCMVRNVISVDSCPCCNTAKPNTGNVTKTVPSLVANGFGDKFKKPEGSWNCDSCMLQNEAKVTECVACAGVKPGSKKLDNSTTNTSSNLQFSFGMPPNTGSFKFGIDKADQQKTDNVTPMNNFKFGESQQSTQVGQFTFGIQREEKKTSSESLQFENSASLTVGSGFGLLVNPKTIEKTDQKQDSEKVEKKPISSFSFGMPKTENATAENDKQSVNVAPTIQSTTLPSIFTFGVSKSEIKQSNIEKGKQDSLLANSVTEVSKPSTKTTESSTITSASTLTSITQSSSQELKSTPLFTFGVPNSTVAVSSSVPTSVITSLPSSTQSSFVFPETKPAQTTPVPTFGQIPSASASTPSSTFTFGENKTKEGTSTTKTFGALPNGSSGSSIFSNISSTPSLFGTSDAKTTATFRSEENKQPTFGTTASKPSAFAIPETKVPTFGSIENKHSIFGSSDTKIPVFGSTDTKPAPLFNPTPQAPTSTTTSTFSAPSVAPSLFGSSVTPVFGNNTSATFSTESKPNIFGSTAKSAETNTPNSNLFTFNATPAQPVAQLGSGFKFSANTNPTGSTQKPLFTFGSNTSTPKSSNVFGGTFNNPGSSNSSGFTFNTPKPEASAFGQSTVTTPIFGAPQSGSQDQPLSSFPSAPANTGFNFGSTAAATPSGGFNFGAVAPASSTSAGFNFNPPSATPTFDPNTPPSFNFTGGNAPPMFSGTPQALAHRKIKKAFRRMR